MQHESDCIFCQIFAGKADAFKVDEDELTMSFMDIFPVAPGHTLLITKEHFNDVMAATPQAIAAIGARSVALAGAIERALRPQGIGIYQLNGAAAGQTVFHYHMHLIPRNDGDSLQIHSRERGDPATLAQTAALLSRELSRAD